MPRFRIFQSSLMVALTLVVAISSTVGPKRAEAARALFVFGDSLVDSGNNNYLLTTARADSAPYGIDYPTHRPTGRFSNGFNLPDLISQQIGSEPTLPYLSPDFNASKLLVGANFASAGIGILNDTGIQFAGTIRIAQQFQLFEEYQRTLAGQVGAAQAQRIVQGGLVLMTLGGNDFVNNYFWTPFSARSRQFTIPQFSRFLISEFKEILKRLYELGARRVLVSGTGPLGCIPSQLATKSRNGECVPELQQAAQIFNPLLVQMTRELNSEVGRDVFVAVNAYLMNMNFITDPQRFGFVTSKVACCGQGPYNGLGRCNPTSDVCPNRDDYAFWDAFHPTQRALGFMVKQMLNGTADYMSPMNLTTIMALDAHP